MSDLYAEHRHGFVWGQVNVTRMSEHEGYKCISVGTTGSDKGVHVYVSPKGRSIRVFKDGKELK